MTWRAVLCLLFNHWSVQMVWDFWSKCWALLLWRSSELSVSVVPAFPHFSEQFKDGFDWQDKSLMAQWCWWACTGCKNWLPMNKEIGGRKGKGDVRTSESQEVDLACFNTSQREMLTEFLEQSSYWAQHEEKTKEKGDKKEKAQSLDQTLRADTPRWQQIQEKCFVWLG